jgi:hypothetical protein
MTNPKIGDHIVVGRDGWPDSWNNVECEIIPAEDWPEGSLSEAFLDEVALFTGKRSYIIRRVSDGEYGSVISDNILAVI